MTNYEAIKFCGGLIKTLQQLAVKPQDYKYVDLFERYLQMKEAGEKVPYIVAVLATDFGISERKVYYLVQVFGRDCTELAQDNGV